VRALRAGPVESIFLDGRLQRSSHGPAGPPKVMKTLNCSPARQQGDRRAAAGRLELIIWTGVFNRVGACADFLASTEPEPE